MLIELMDINIYNLNQIELRVFLCMCISWEKLKSINDVLLSAINTCLWTEYSSLFSLVGIYLWSSENWSPQRDAIAHKMFIWILKMFRFYFCFLSSKFNNRKMAEYTFDCTCFFRCYFFSLAIKYHYYYHFLRWDQVE